MCSEHAKKKTKTAKPNSVRERERPKSKSHGSIFIHSCHDRWWSRINRFNNIKYPDNIGALIPLNGGWIWFENCYKNSSSSITNEWIIIFTRFNEMKEPIEIDMCHTHTTRCPLERKSKYVFSCVAFWWLSEWAWAYLLYEKKKKLSNGLLTSGCWALNVWDLAFAFAVLNKTTRTI